MTTFRQYSTPGGASGFPLARVSAAERALYGNPKVTDRFVPETLALAGNTSWRSIKPRVEGDPASGSTLNLMYGGMPTVLATGGPKSTPCVQWPIGQQAIFGATGINLPLGMSGSMTVAVVMRPRLILSLQNGIIAASRGTRGTSGISFWGYRLSGSDFILSQVTQYTGSLNGADNVVGSEFANAAKDWLVIVWTRRGGVSTADLRTYYGKLVGGVFQWANHVSSTTLPYLHPQLMIGGSLSQSDATIRDAYSANYDMRIADLIIMEGHDVIDDTVTLNQLADLWFPKYFV